MLSGFARLILTSTAIAPVGFVYSFVAYSQGQNTTASVILLVCIFLYIICQFMIKYARVNIEITNFKAEEIEASDKENVSFMLLYMLPLFTDKVETLNWSIWVPTILIFGAVTATGYSYHFNPLIGLLGWHFYKVKSQDGVTFVLITKRNLRSAAGQLKVGQLTECILLDMDKSDGQPVRGV